MKTTLALLVGSSALSATLGLPTFASTRAPHFAPATQAAPWLDTEAQQTLPVVRVSGEQDDGEDDDGEDDDGEDDDGEDDDGEDDDGEDDCEDDARCGLGGNPAPAGTTAPPANGLFAPGALPRAQVN